jgi:hypothetical protein
MTDLIAGSVQYLIVGAVVASIFWRVPYLIARRLSQGPDVTRTRRDLAHREAGTGKAELQMDPNDILVEHPAMAA